MAPEQSLCMAEDPWCGRVARGAGARQPTAAGESQGGPSGYSERCRSHPYEAKLRCAVSEFG